MSLEVIQTIATCVAALAAIAAVFVAWWQLGNLNKTLRMNALTVVLGLESEMNMRKMKVDEVATDIRRLDCEDNENNSKLIGILSDYMEGLLENWLNCADRLAYCIKQGYLADKDWKIEYREYFNDLVKDHPDKFRADTIYTNLLDLNNKWKRE